MASSIVTTHQFLNSGEGVGPDGIFRQFGGVRVGGVTLPMPPSRVGGDSIGAVAVGDGFVSFVADGQGKGILASHLGAMMRHCVLSAIRGGTTSPTEILHKLNCTLLTEHILGAAAIMHCDGRRLTASVAGSPAPAVFHPDGTMEQLPITGTILGVSPFPEFDSCTRDILPSAFVAIFSDGVTEAESPDGELFELERFGGILERDQSVAANLLRCVDAVLTHSGQQQDDLSLLIVQAHGWSEAVDIPAFGIAPEYPGKPGRQPRAAYPPGASIVDPLFSRAVLPLPSIGHAMTVTAARTVAHRSCDTASPQGIRFSRSLQRS